MKRKLFLSNIVVKKSSTHGFGVFAEKTFKKGDLIEECYIILTKGGDLVLEDYYFECKRQYALFTGFGSIYNHADDPNADYTINANNRIARIKAIRTIPKGSEILISYGDEWFSSRGLTPKKMKK